MKRLESIATISRSLLEQAKEVFPTTLRSLYGEALFEKSTSHGESMITLWAHGTSVDVAAHCSLARSIVETNKAATYLLERGLSEDEKSLRLLLFGLNHATNLFKINGSLEGSDSLRMEQHQVDYLKHQIEDNSFFQALPSSQQKNLLRGRNPFVHQWTKRTHPMEYEMEKAVTDTFSQYVHAYSLGLPMLGGGDLTMTGTVNAFALAESAAASYLASHALAYLGLRHRAIGPVAPSQRKTLENEAAGKRVVEIIQKISSKRKPRGF